DWQNGHENGAPVRARRARQKKARSAHATPPCIRSRIFFRVPRRAPLASVLYVSLFAPAHRARVSMLRSELAHAVLSDTRDAAPSRPDKASRAQSYDRVAPA